MEVKVPELRLIEQPSHSQVLNPAEHLWDDLRENEFHNKALVLWMRWNKRYAKVS